MSAFEASRRSQVEPFFVMEVLKAAAERQRTHGDVIMLCAGQAYAIRIALSARSCFWARQAWVKPNYRRR